MFLFLLQFYTALSLSLSYIAYIRFYVRALHSLMGVKIADFRKLSLHVIVSYTQKKNNKNTLWICENSVNIFIYTVCRGCGWVAAKKKVNFGAIFFYNLNLRCNEMQALYTRTHERGQIGNISRHQCQRWHLAKKYLFSYMYYMLLCTYNTVH